MVGKESYNPSRQVLIVLAAEDDRADRFFLTEAVQSAGMPVALHTVRDGEEALKYLRAEGEFGDREKHPVPDLLLLDLKMPNMSGLEVLRWVKENPDYKWIPAIVLSGSVMMDDIREAYDLGASGFFTKPNSFEELKQTVRRILEYWRGCQRVEALALTKQATAAKNI